MYQFLSATGRAHHHEVPENVGFAIKYIVEYYPAAGSEPQSESSSHSRKSSSEPPAFPYTWATDIPTFRRAVKAFRDRTHHFRKEADVAGYLKLQIDPPSTGGSPEDSPTGDPPMTSEFSDVNDSFTRATSAEEGIYSQLIDPDIQPDIPDMAQQMTPQQLQNFIANAVNAAVLNLNLPPGPFL